MATEEAVEVGADLVALVGLQVVTLRASCLEEAGALLAVAYTIVSVRQTFRHQTAAVAPEWQEENDWHPMAHLSLRRAWTEFLDVQCQRMRSAPLDEARSMMRLRKRKHTCFEAVAALALCHCVDCWIMLW